MADQKRDVLFLLDGTSLAYRAYYALLRGGRPGDGRPTGFTTHQGMPTGAVYGFLATVRKLLADHKPRYAGIAFDTAAPTLRQESFAAYKANRKPMPEDLVAQIPHIFQAAEALRIPMLTRDGYEADDIIGTFALKGVEAGLDVVLVTLDKDMYQLLGPHVSMLQLRSEPKLVRAEDVPAEFGVTPAQVIDVLALWGDPSDNIPGVPGIGEKGACALLTAWGSLEGVYANLASIKPALAAKLRAGEASARLSQKLATIHTDLDLPFDLKALQVDPIDREKLHALALAMEFKSLARETAPQATVPESAHVTLCDPPALQAWMDRARSAGRLAIEPFASSVEPMRAVLHGFGLSAPGLDPAYVPCAPSVPAATAVPGDTPSALPYETVVAILRPALEDSRLLKSGGNLKFTSVVLARLGVHLAGLDHDAGILAYLLDPGRGTYALEALASEFCGRAPTELPASARGAESSSVSVAAAASSFSDRASIALSVGQELNQRLSGSPLEALYRDMELPLVAVLGAMERRGVRLDLDNLRRQSLELEQRLAELSRHIHELAGVEFNIASPRQLGEILFDKMNLPVLKKTRKSKTASTDIEVLEELARDHEFPRLVLEHRELAKLKGTYIDSLPALVNPGTGRVHTSYHQTVAATGRLSSADPNLQNIPVRTEAGRRIRSAFVAEPGWLLVSADYSQIELRLLAHLSGDPELISAFRDGADIHTRTAATMLGMPEALITVELRRRAKAINFGIIYGMSAFGLSKELGIANSEAARLIADYFARYRGVRDWLDRTISEARETGRVLTLHGRVRYLPEIRSDNRSTREYAERTATNTPIQGSAADLIKLAMLRVAGRLEAEKLAGRLIMQVHDELVLEVPEAESERVQTLVREEMVGAAQLAVPLEVSVGVGPDWLAAK